ncbi:MAG: STAS domain-containing protein, partial [Hyphococcus sp.]
FRTASRKTAAKVVLDFRNAGDIDQAFLGLVLMLEKHVAARGASISICGANKRHLRLLKANNMRYPDYADAKAHIVDPALAAGSRPLETPSSGNA